MEVPIITLYGNDLLAQRFLLRYLDKAKRTPGYEQQVVFIENKLKEIEDYYKSDPTALPKIPNP